jgi:NADH:ubiquinone oxidoreductase subunit F (NADH-binding)
MTIRVHRVLFPRPIRSLEEYLGRGGGRGIQAARQMTPDQIIAKVTASGLRGRGGAGFPAGRKWRTVAENGSPVEPSTVVVNGAEGEPGTFKDRAILRTNPYHILEGALIAARAVGADLIVVALKRSFEDEVTRVRAAIEEVRRAGWTDGVDLTVFEGPDEYLYGEESALLEAIQGRYPFPRIVPTFRRGLLKVGEADSSQVGNGPAGSWPAAPALVNNVETTANIPRIVARGPASFRRVGTEESPGTVVCTVTGRTRHHGVGEVRMGTPLRQVIQRIGGGPRSGRSIKAVMCGVANGIIPASLLDTPVSYEGMAAIGSGLGSAGFIVFDDTVDMTAVAAGAARFLAVESCGQCVPCKQDGLSLAELLAKLCRSQATAHDLDLIRRRLLTVTDRSRCYLATQQQNVVGSILARFADEVAAHLAGTAPPREPELIAELVDIKREAVFDERHRHKQPDWSYDRSYSGKVPAECLLGVAPPWRTGGQG